MAALLGKRSNGLPIVATFLPAKDATQAISASVLYMGTTSLVPVWGSDLVQSALANERPSSLWDDK